MSALRARPYQTEALAALHKTWAEGVLRAAIVLPTGMGKTVIIGHQIAEEVEAGRRPVVLVHRDELAHQTVGKIRAILPDTEVGIVKAGRNETCADVLVCSVQTLAREARREQIPPGSVDLVVVDECHHASAQSYVDILTYFGCFEGTRAVGFTATLARNDSRGLGNVWERVAYKRDVLFGIKGGYLSDVRGRALEIDGFNLAEVARSRGDYQDGSLGEALLSVDAGTVIADRFAEHAGGRQGVLFAPTVATAEVFADDLREAGIETAVITGATPTEDRQLIYKRFQAGEIQVLSNCMVLTEGFDAPWASCAVIARPTQSPSLYVQMVGRVLRPWPGKADALVLDVVGTARTHRLATLAELVDGGLPPKDGESIREAVERFEREAAEREVSAEELGAVRSYEVDLFHQSRSAWLRTYSGIWFIPTRKRTFVVHEEGTGTYRVGHCGVYNKRDAKWELTGLPLEYAMAWAEQWAEEADSSISSRNAPWRRNKAPSEGQVTQATKCGIPLEHSDGTPLSRGELSDQLSIFYASRLLDPRRKK